jgi:trimethylguanosine synthase
MQARFPPALYSQVAFLGDVAEPLPSMSTGVAVSATVTASEQEQSTARDARVRRRGTERHVTRRVKRRTIDRYVARKHILWSRFDEGIQMTWNSFYEVTPEPIALHIATRFQTRIADSLLLADLFAGVGSNAIAMARLLTTDAPQRLPYVVAVDHNAVKCEMLQQNARIYGVAQRIDVVIGDAFAFVRRWRRMFDGGFASPPWGGPAYRRRPVYNLDAMRPYCASEIFRLGWQVSPNFAVLLPRNSDVSQLAEIARRRPLEVEENWLEGRLITLTVYSGALVQP